MKPIISALVLALATIPVSAYAFNTGSLMPSLDFTEKTTETVTQDQVSTDK